MVLLHSAACASAVPVEVIEAKLREIRFTSFSVSEATLSDTLTSLRKKADRITAENPVPGAVPLDIILVPSAAVPGDTGNHPPLTVSYDGSDVTLETILREIGKTANHDVFLTSAGVVFTPKGLPPFPNPSAEKGDIFRQITSAGSD
ncbi:MAG: hypothetical protein EOP86_26130 [Verrucomicrobiaceae bacterium]|nr:MAG: hypothetical protein EOP86_26130 [Verrucomicrobiaceae bacterium]